MKADNQPAVITFWLYKDNSPISAYELTDTQAVQGFSLGLEVSKLNLSKRQVLESEKRE